MGYNKFPVPLAGGCAACWQQLSSIVAADRRDQDSYTTVDVAFGLARSAWSAELFIENLGDERAQLFFNVQDDVPRITTNRPRTMGLRLSYDF